MQFLKTEAAFGLNLSQFSDRIYAQMSDALAAEGILVPAKSTGIIQVLFSEGPCSQADIASQLRTSHQLIAQRVTALLKQSILELKPDPNDGRRKLLLLTKKGRDEGQKLQSFLPKLIRAYHDLNAEIGLDFHDLITRANRALDGRSLSDRLGGQTQS